MRTTTELPGPPPPAARLLVGTYVALMALLGATVWLATLDLGRASPYVAFGIAGAKAALVIGIFMEWRAEGPVVRLVGFAAVFWLVVGAALTLADYLTR
jgi:cytochrome c oxidase subunit 4